MKDPRMGLLLSLWKPHMPEMVCLIVLKDPVRNAISLARNVRKSSKGAETNAAGVLPEAFAWYSSAHFLLLLRVQ